MIFDGSTPLTMTGQCLCNYCINASSLYHEMNFTYSATVSHPEQSRRVKRRIIKI
jgi:hypothetical protein